MKEVILIKVGEIYLKGKNRQSFLSQLKENLKTTLSLPAKAIKKISEGVFEIDYQKEKLEKLQYVFGIAKFAKYYKFSSFEELQKGLVKELLPKILSENNFSTFKIEATRENKKFPFNSMEIQKKLGEEVLNNFNQLKVSLDSPQLKIIVEVRQKGFYLSDNFQQREGLGGLPVGVSGKALALISGGIDSPVAAFLAMKRGLTLGFVYFHTPPFVGDKTKMKVIDIIKILKKYHPPKVEIFIPYFTNIQLKIREKTAEPFWTLLTRRYMLKLAEIISEKENYNCLITGDNLGQVASQTLENLVVESFNIKKLILRPLIGFDKKETIALAKKIQTYPLSILPFEDCCTVFSPRNPITKADFPTLKKEEKKIEAELKPLFKESLQKMEKLTL